MVSDEQRREIAGKLRSLDERIEGMPLMCTKQEHNAMALRAIRAVVGKGDIFHLLADLIDRPTCRNIYAETVKVGACENGFKCSECGNTVEDCEGYRVSGEFNYCSKCGAKIETYNGIEDAVKTWNTRAIDRDELMAIADELENKFFVVYDSHGEIDHADCFVERIMKAVDA